MASIRLDKYFFALAQIGNEKEIFLEFYGFSTCIAFGYKRFFNVTHKNSYIFYLHMANQVNTEQCDLSTIKVLIILSTDKSFAFLKISW